MQNPLSSPRPAGAVRSRLRSGSAAATALALWLVVASCGEYLDVGGVPPAAPTPAALSADVPVFDIRGDSAALANMRERFLEDIEVAVTVDVYRDGARVLDARGAEVQVKGSGSAYYPLKSLGIKFDEDIDNGDGRLLTVPEVLRGHDLGELRAVRLRNGGQDFHGTLVKDLAYARLMAGADLAVVPLYGEPAAAFVNGAFYGLLNLRTESNANGLSRLLGVRKRDLHLGEVEDHYEFFVKAGDGAPFRALAAAVRAEDREAALALVDEASFIDFVLAGTIFSTWPWPSRNVRAYAVGDGPLRFLSFDHDHASEWWADQGIVEQMRTRPPSLIGDLFELAIADPGFLQRLEARLDALIAGGRLHPRRLRRAFEDLTAAYAPIIAHQTAQYGTPVSEGSWLIDAERHVRDYERRWRGLTGDGG